MGNPFKKSRNSKHHKIANETSVDGPYHGDENTERGNWSRQIEFFLACMGYAVGLGNIWRFPYLCMRNGGGAFLIPYFLFLVLGGIPLFFLELALGQFSGQSPLSIWRITPLFGGLGWGMVIVSAINAIYFNVVITYVLYYLGKSFVRDLPWGSCDNKWNSPECDDLEKDVSSTNLSLSAVNTTSMITSSMGLEQTTSSLFTNVSANITVQPRTAAEEFWQFHVLDLSDGIHDMGGFRWELVICLAVSWFLVFICLVKGVKSLGKVVYVTATLPYIFLTILLIRGCLLPGSLEGIKYYIVPDFHKLKNFNVWCEACLQIFYSLGPAWGGIIAMASYNKFHNNCLRDGLLVPIINCGTSFYAGFVIFSVIGFMAHETGLPIDRVISSGPGLAFTAYPEALTKMPFSPFWAVLFFLMLLTVGLDTQFAAIETLISSYIDQYPGFARNHKVMSTAGLCIFLGLLGLPLVTRGGMYVFQLLDWYCAAFSVIVIAILECVSFTWIYGTDRLFSDLEMMLGKRPHKVWAIVWKVVTPALLLVILVYNMINLKPPVYGVYHFPSWAIGIGFVIAVLPIIPIPLVMIVRLLKTKGTLLQRIKFLLQPAANWGPSYKKYQEDYAAKYPTGLQISDKENRTDETTKLSIV